MKTFKNENGYALLMVLMLIILFTVLGMGLMATNMNSAKQFTMKEDQVQARHQAEMGVLHYVAQAEELLKERNQAITNSATNVTNANAVFCSSLNETVQNPESTYQVNIVTSLNRSCLDGDILEIKINSKGLASYDGSAGENVSKEVVADLEINKEIPSGPEQSSPEDGEGGNDTDEEAIDYEVIVGDPFIKNSEDLTSKRSLYYQNGLSTKNGNDNRGATIVIEENLKVDGEFAMGTHGCLAVGNDLKLNDRIYIKNDFYVYVYGDLYLREGQDIDVKEKIYVNGDVYLDDSKVSPKPGKYPSFTNAIQSNMKHGNCTLPWIDKPDYRIPIWGFDDEINAIYK